MSIIGIDPEDQLRVAVNGDFAVFVFGVGLYFKSWELTKVGCSHGLQEEFEILVPFQCQIIDVAALVHVADKGLIQDRVGEEDSLSKIVGCHRRCSGWNWG